MAKGNSLYLSGSVLLTVSVFAGCSGSEGGVTLPAGAGGTSAGTTQTVGGATAQGGGGTLSTGGSTVSSNGSSTMATTAVGGSLAATGGAVSTTGGSAATGGTHATGGANPTGGSKPTTGGASSTGGSVATGGSRPTGGTAATGGASPTGGSTSSSGLGSWTTGYVATMYGNYQSGDCAGYSNFTDTTNYNSQTCPNVTSKNATWYAALGDLSSLWVGGECQCPGGSTGDCSQAPSCPSESASGGDCGICVAVKCDASGTFSLSGSTHDSDCNTSTYVVVQIIDACPHNHPTNVASSEGWCTSRQANHIDLSCSGLGGISTLGTSVGRDGWLNVDVQKVSCSSFTFGTHSL